LGNFGKIIQDFILYAVSKVGVVLIGAEAFEGKNCDALSGRRPFDTSLV
jgi:hypothetical protein